MEFDENKAIEAMRCALPEDKRSLYDDDELLNIIDMIWDYYEENGMLDIDLVEDDEEDEDIHADLCTYVGRMLRKDKGANVAPEDIPLLVAAELKYEDSLSGTML